MAFIDMENKWDASYWARDMMHLVTFISYVKELNALI